MSLLSTLYTEIIYRPLFNGLAGVYALLPYPDLGLAIILLTVIMRVVLHPTIAQTIRSQRAMAALQPKLREIQARFKDSREEVARRTMALYRESGVHPLSGCLPVLIQLPVLIGLYQVFWKGIAAADPALLYPLLSGLGVFDPIAFGLFDLTVRSAPLAIAAGLSQFLSSRLMSPPAAAGPEGMAQAMRWQMVYVFPVIIAAISWSLPSALALYWTVFNLIAILQQRWIEHRMGHERHPRAHQPDAGEDGHRRRG